MNTAHVAVCLDMILTAFAVVVVAGSVFVCYVLILWAIQITRHVFARVQRSYDAERFAAEEAESVGVRLPDQTQFGA